MFDWLWGKAWSAVAQAVRPLAKKQAHKALATLRSLRASTTSDLAELIASSGTLNDMKLIARGKLDQLVDPKDSTNVAQLRTVPLEFFTSSTILSARLASKLKENTDLRALRNTLGVDVAEWNEFIDAYATAFVKFFARDAIEKLIDSDANVYGEEFIVAIADGEGYKFDETEKFQSMIKFFKVRGGNGRATEINRVRGLWKRRHKIIYKRNV